MTHTLTANNPVARRNSRIAILRGMKTRMINLRIDEQEIKEKLLNVCLYRWALTTRSANDYLKVVMIPTDYSEEKMLAFKEEQLTTTSV